MGDLVLLKKLSLGDLRDLIFGENLDWMGRLGDLTPRCVIFKA